MLIVEFEWVNFFGFFKGDLLQLLEEVILIEFLKGLLLFPIKIYLVELE